MSMGMFNIGENALIRDMFNTLDEKDFKLPATQTEATSKKLQVLRTYADGSAALVQRAAPDLLEGMDSAIYARAKKLLPPSLVNEQTDVNLMPAAQRLGQIDPQVLKDTMSAKIQALTKVMAQDTGVMADESLSNNFKKTTDLTNDLIVSRLKPNVKHDLAMTLKPLLESFRKNYTNELKTLADLIPAAKQDQLEKAKLGDFKGLQPHEVQYIEKFQRLQSIDEQLSAINKLIQVPEES